MKYIYLFIVIYLFGAADLNAQNKFIKSGDRSLVSKKETSKVSKQGRNGNNQITAKNTFSLPIKNHAGNVNPKSGNIGFTNVIDTLFPPSFTDVCFTSDPNALTIYSGTDGFAFGTNTYADLQCAQLYNNSYTGTLTEALVYIGYSAVGANSNVYANVYDVDAVTGEPGNLLGTSDPVTVSAIDVTNLTSFMFSTPVAVGKSFFISVEYPTGANDTIGVVSTNDACYSNTDLAWNQWSDGTWYTAAYSWTLNVDLAIFPIVDLDVPAEDAEINFVYSPIGGCNLTATETVRARIKNNGTAAISNFNVGYTINGGSTVSEVVAGPINAGDTMTYTFNTSVDLSAPGTYNVAVFTQLTNDADLTNDTVSYSIDNLSPISLSSPYTMGFEASESLAGWTYEDVNDDATSWYISSTRGNTLPNAASINYNMTEAADDYLFTPCFDLKANNTYQFDFYYKVGATYTENLALKIGSMNNAASMTQTIVDLPGIINDTYMLSTNQFTVPSTGIYYFGFHVYSDPDQWFVAIDDINISIPTSINENNSAVRFGIFPNPSSTGRFNLASNVKDSKADLKVINAMGQVVLQANNVVNGEIDLSSQPQGVYFVEIKSGENITNKKIVITGR